jgi:hypothetical protein
MGVLFYFQVVGGRKPSRTAFSPLLSRFRRCVTSVIRARYL